MTVNAIQNSLCYPAIDQPFNTFNTSDRFNTWCNLIILIIGIYFQLNSRTIASDGAFICLDYPTQEIPIYSSKSCETPVFTFHCLPLTVELYCTYHQCMINLQFHGLHLTPEPTKAAFGTRPAHNLDPEFYCNNPLVDITQLANCTFHIHSSTGCRQGSSNPVLSKLSELTKAWPDFPLPSAYNYVKTQDKRNPLLLSIFMEAIPSSCTEKTTGIPAFALKEYISNNRSQPNIFYATRHSHGSQSDKDSIHYDYAMLKITPQLLLLIAQEVLLFVHSKDLAKFIDFLEARQCYAFRMAETTSMAFLEKGTH